MKINDYFSYEIYWNKIMCGGEGVSEGGGDDEPEYRVRVLVVHYYNIYY
jgi:hypothetical protein